MKKNCMIIAENEDFADIRVRLCYLDDFNYNGICLTSDNNPEDSVATLVDTPVVAYYNKTNDDFEGHNVTRTSKGVKFGTYPIGNHTKAWIEDSKVIPVFSETGEEVELPCMFAEARIYKSRFPQAFEVIKRRIEQDKMYSSWELKPVQVESVNVDNNKIPNPRKSNEWRMLGNCLLGSKKVYGRLRDITPAYGKNSKVLEISESEYLDDFDIELSEALAIDVSQVKEEQQNVENNEGGNEEVGKKTIENSALTSNDLRKKLSQALNKAYWEDTTGEVAYYYMWRHYPEDHKLYAHQEGASDDEITIFTYSVNENDEITLSEGTVRRFSELFPAVVENAQIQIKLDDTAKLLSEKEIKIKEVESELSEAKDKLAISEKEVAEAGKAIADLTKEKEELSTQISELTPYKEKVVKMEKAEIERQLNEKKDELKKFTLEDNLVSEVELEDNEELKTIFSELTLENYETSQERVELIKGRKALEKYRLEKSEKENESNEENDVETSEKDTKEEKAQVDLSSGDEGCISAIDIVKKMVKK